MEQPLHSTQSIIANTHTHTDTHWLTWRACARDLSACRLSFHHARAGSIDFWFAILTNWLWCRIVDWHPDLRYSFSLSSMAIFFSDIGRSIAWIGIGWRRLPIALAVYRYITDRVRPQKTRAWNKIAIKIDDDGWLTSRCLARPSWHSHRMNMERQIRHLPVMFSTE